MISNILGIRLISKPSNLKQVMSNDATIVIIICEGYCIVLYIR